MRFWPLYTKADGGFLRRFRPDPEIFYRVRYTPVRVESLPPQVVAWVVIGMQNRKASACWPRAFRLRYALLRRIARVCA